MSLAKSEIGRQMVELRSELDELLRRAKEQWLEILRLIQVNTVERLLSLTAADTGYEARVNRAVAELMELSRAARAAQQRLSELG